MPRSTSLLYCFLLLVFFSALPLALWAQDSVDLSRDGEKILIQQEAPNSENALNRLIEISSQLSNLNERLREELQDSRQSSRELQTMLEASRKELEGLKQELEALRHNSTGLLIKAENSQTELTMLLSTLRKAEYSLMSLELSFAAYRETAEREISTLAKEKRLWKWGFVAAGVLAVGFGGAFFLGR